MKLPETFTVLGQTVAVEAVGDGSPIWADGHEHHAYQVLGSYERSRQSVKVRTEGISEDQVRETVLHEALHAVINMGGFIAYLHGDDDEVFVKAITPQLLDFLRSNPKVVRFLLQGAA
jgi:hypothetical protein